MRRVAAVVALAVLIALGLVAGPSLAARQPVLRATLAWEQNALSEPSVLYEGGRFRMWYRGGWEVEAIGYAESADGRSWTKRGDPILGQGFGGVRGNAAQPEVVRVGDELYLYYTEFLESGDMRVARSSDGIRWSVESGAAIARPPGLMFWGNRTVWREGVRWRMLLEGMTTGEPWRIWLASSEDGLAWSLDGPAVVGLQVAPGGMYGGPFMAHTRPYEVWYHAAPASGNLPTDIFRATSKDLRSWAVEPMLRHAGTGFEIDQVADPAIVLLNGQRYLFYDGDDNLAARAAIGLIVGPSVSR